MDLQLPPDAALFLSSHFALKETLGFFMQIIVRVGSGISAHNFDSDLAVDTHIFPKIDIAHATAAKQAQDMITIDLSAFE